MRKLRLEDLAVESFATNPAKSASGTVEGYETEFAQWTCGTTCPFTCPMTCKRTCEEYCYSPAGAHSCDGVCNDNNATYGPEARCYTYHCGSGGGDLPNEE